MNYVFDIDGTLSFNGRSISNEIRDALIQLSKDHQIIFASARPIRDMVNIIPKALHDSLWIGGNGTFVRKNGLINTKEIAGDDLNKILNLIYKENLDYMIDSDWDYAYKGSLETTLYNNISKESANNLPLEALKSVCKIVIFDPQREQLEFLEELDISLTFHSDENLVDISKKGCSKASALKELDITEYIAFGNDANDVSMFRNAQRSYCIKESQYSQFATYTIEKEDVAHTILNEAKGCH